MLFSRYNNLTSFAHLEGFRNAYQKKEEEKEKEKEEEDNSNQQQRQTYSR